MGMLVDGEWRDVWYDTLSTGGRFVRQKSTFRNWITPDGAAGPTGGEGFPGGAGPLSPLRQPGVPVGPPNPDHAAA
jgi:putative glutathione S-transferase